MTVESEKDLAGLRRVGRVVGLALREMRENLEPGMTTGELDGVGARLFERFGARSAPQLVYGFPGVNCISVNDEAVHGVPGDRVIERGDLVKIDVTAELDGYIADAAVTVALPPVAPPNDELREFAFGRAASVVRAGRPINKIGRVVETAVCTRGFTVLTQLSSVEGGDGWTIKTADGSPAAHHEHTIIVTKGSPIVLTAA